MTLNFGQNLFPPRGEFLINYDYTDLIQGTGIANFYGIKMVLTGGSTYHLIEAPTEGGMHLVGATRQNPQNIPVCGVTHGPNATFTFDTNEFRKIMTLKGIANVVIPLAVFIGAGETINSTITVIDIRLVHVHKAGGTTNLTNDFDLPVFEDTATGEATIGNIINNAFFVAFNTIAGTKILKGDQIRLSMTITGSGGLAGNNTGWALLHNPSGGSVKLNDYDGDHTATITQLKLSLPFKINL